MPRLLIQVGVGLGLLHWANMSNISLTKRLLETLSLPLVAPMIKSLWKGVVGLFATADWATSCHAMA